MNVDHERACDPVVSSTLMCLPAETIVLSKSSTLTNVQIRTDLNRFNSARVGPCLNRPTSVQAGKSMTFGSEEGRIAYQLVCPCETSVFLFLDQIKREKGVW